MLVCTIATVAASDSHSSDYTFTRARARKLVLAYCRTDCHGLFLKPPAPCCDVFEQAMRGDVAALRRVFTERDLHSGDNESWSFTAWPLLHVVGDRRFAAFLHTLTTAEQSDVFEQFFYEGSYVLRPSEAATSSGHFIGSQCFTASCSHAKHLTRRCSRCLAGLFPPFMTIKIPPETASRALASRG